MKNNLVSILIPAYNTEKYVGDMLECCINQTYRNIEIIIVDDGSVDNTSNIIDHYANIDKRIKAFHIKNSGVSKARNLAIENATGSKIFMWDSDDIIELDAIEKCLNFAKKENVESVLYSFSDRVNGVNVDVRNLKLKKKYMQDEIIDKLLPAFIGHSFDDVNNWIDGKVGMREGKEHTALWRAMLDSKVIKENDLKFDSNMSLGEDTKFMNEYLLTTKSVGVLNECLYHLTLNENGLNHTSLKNSKKMVEDKIKIIRAKEEISKYVYKKYNVSIEKYWYGTIVFSCIQCALKCAKNKNNKYKENKKTYEKYMSNPIVTKVRNEFKPHLKLKGYPFIFIKGNRYKLLFLIAYLLPRKIVKKFI